MFFIMAFRNVLKNKRATLTIIFVVFISVFFMEFTMGYMDGFKKKITDDAMKVSGHIKIYNKKYYEDMYFKPVEYNLPYDRETLDKIRSVGNIEGIRAEINFGAIANSKTDNSNVLVQGIDYRIKGPYEKLRKNIIKGRFIRANKEFIIGYKLAELLKVNLNEDIILLSIDKYGSINATEGKIVGIYNYHSPTRDGSMVTTSLEQVQDLLGIGNRVTSYIVNTNDLFNADAISEKLKKIFPRDYAIIPWQEANSFLKSSFKMMDIFVFIISAIILFVAGMGITNSFLMNIMSRFSEYGVLRTMGVTTKQLFSMIISESFLLGVFGSVAGLIPGIGVVYYFSIHPFDFSKMAESFEYIDGLDALIGLSLNIRSVIFVFLIGVLISLFASVYPAVIAIKKRPSEILRLER